MTTVQQRQAVLQLDFARNPCRLPPVEDEETHILGFKTESSLTFRDDYSAQCSIIHCCRFPLMFSAQDDPGLISCSRAKAQLLPLGRSFRAQLPLKYRTYQHGHDRAILASM
jgi:hypothetical protein